jgi:hypothetical protein
LEDLELVILSDEHATLEFRKTEETYEVVLDEDCVRHKLAFDRHDAGNLEEFLKRCLNKIEPEKGHP